MRRSPWLLAFIAVGCFGQKDTLGLPCDFDTQCDIGQECRMGECTDVGETTGCMGAEVELAPLASRVMLVVDRSAAMADEWDDDGEPGTPQQPRWSTVVAALAAELAAIDGLVDLGLVLVPSTDACALEPAPTVAIAPGSASACVDALPESPLGGDPIGAALALGVEQLRAQTGPAPRSIVLVLAGAPSCEGDDLEAFDPAAETTIAGALTDGIPTVVVGVAPSTEVDTSPDNGRPDGVAASDAAMALALAGGRARNPDGYYRADNGITLGLTVRDALFAARGCVLPRPEGIAGQEDVTMRIDGETVPRIDTCDDAGFVVREDAIEVCGNSCAQLKLTGTAIVTTACE